jgi:hypothetical protein
MKIDKDDDKEEDKTTMALEKVEDDKRKTRQLSNLRRMATMKMLIKIDKEMIKRKTKDHY